MLLIDTTHGAQAVADTVVTGGTVRVAHSQARLSRGLGPGEPVVLRDADGGFHAAHVVDLEFDLHDTHYVLEVGARLPGDMAAERLEDLHLVAPRQPLHDVVDLLGQLRRG